jgi:RNA polymerase sigma factor (sigma-70 family)
MQRDLVERARNGEHEAFSALVDDSISRLYGIARLILRDEDAAEDAVQNTLMHAWINIRALRDPDAWDAWLYRLLVRGCHHLAGQARRRKVVELHVVREPRGDTQADFSRSVVERDQLGRAIGRLPVEHREVLVARFFLDLSVEQVADIFDIPTGTAKSRLHRALNAMRAALAAEAAAAPDAEERGR